MKTKRPTKRENDIIKVQEKLHDMGIKLENMVKLIKGKCSHFYQEEFIWESDNGFGHQTNMKGFKCLCCLERNFWGKVK